MKRKRSTPLKHREEDWDRIRVQHMLDAAKESLAFMKGRDRKELDSDRQLLLALLKELEMIGEAANKVSTEFRAQHPLVPWRAIIATRNRLIHGYFDINRDVVWETIERELPALVATLKNILIRDTP